MKRALYRFGLGAVALIAATAIAAPSASGAETTADLEVAFKGTTLADGVPVKLSLFTVTNNGPEAAQDITFDLDLSGVDSSMVRYWTDGIACQDGDADGIYTDCQFGPLDVGESQDYPWFMERVGDAVGSAGTVKVTVKSDQDENATNNTATAPLVLDEQGGVDLATYAWDIYESTDAGPPQQEQTPVEPGATSLLWVDVANWGTEASAALKMDIRLPDGVTFVGSEPDCDYSTGSANTSCTYTGEAGQIMPDSGERYFFQVKVGAAVAGPVTLGGGLVTVTDLPETPEIRARAAAAPSTKRTVAISIADLDPSDNTDEFNAHVAKGGGQGGGLPVTGARVTMLASVGIGAVVLGGLIFLLTTRRRRTTTPGA